MSRIIHRIILTLSIVFFAFVPGHSAEIDDSTVFIDAFNAFQHKDYLLAIEKCDQLNQVFPDSPLRDVTLLLVARASLKSGDNERAAKFVALFSTEFPDSSLKTSIEEELKVLASRRQKGEVLAADMQLQNAARKVSADRLTREKVAKESINIAIMLQGGTEPVPVGGNGNLAVEFSNTGKNSEEFLLTVTSVKEYDAVLTGVGKPDERVTRLKLAAGETFKGTVVFRMPAEMVDGHRSVMTIKAVSAKFCDISFQKETVVVSSAPLVRAVARLARQKVAPGEKLRYRVTVLNAGSMTARNLTVRLLLPPQVYFQGVPDGAFRQEPNGTIIFTVDQIEMGKLVEINLDVKVRENSSAGQELWGRVEVVNNSLQRKEVFAASTDIV
ncbi:MAG: hypothetical protein WA003_04480, partial [Desulfuromonadaceae bacterium]